MSAESDATIEALLREQNSILRGILAVLVDEHLRSNAELANSKFRSIDQLLKDGAGLTNTEIAAYLGKSPQAVGQVLATGKPSTK
jgi:hypothetical protein